MPLAYYIPGLAQALFGTGLKTGRYFAIFLTGLNLAGIWILLNRLKGKWWALVGVLVLAVNPAVIRVYVQSISEGVVACLLTWSLVLLNRREPQALADRGRRFFMRFNHFDPPEYGISATLRSDLRVLAAWKKSGLAGFGL